jgi:hypothetical protein
LRLVNNVILKNSNDLVVIIIVGFQYGVKKVQLQVEVVEVLHIRVCLFAHKGLKVGRKSHFMSQLQPFIVIEPFLPKNRKQEINEVLSMSNWWILWKIYSAEKFLVCLLAFNALYSFVEQLQPNIHLTFNIWFFGNDPFDDKPYALKNWVISNSRNVEF